MLECYLISKPERTERQFRQQEEKTKLSLIKKILSERNAGVFFNQDRDEQNASSDSKKKRRN